MEGQDSENSYYDLLRTLSPIVWNNQLPDLQIRLFFIPHLNIDIYKSTSDQIGPI